MKKLLLTLSIVLALAAVAICQTAPGTQTAPGAPGQAAQPGQATAPGAPPSQAAQQKKEIKDPNEYNAYVGAIQAADPNAKITQLEAFLQQYPNSVMKEDALEAMMIGYQQTNNLPKMMDTAQRLLQVNPNHVAALALLAFGKRTMAETGTNAQQNLQEAAQFGQRGLQALQNYQKPEGMSDADFQKRRTQLGEIFNGAIGLAALQAKDYPTAQRYLRGSAESNPNNLKDIYPLALAYLEVQPSDPQGLFFIARAINLAAGTPAQAQIAKYGKNRYIKYHGGDDGWDQLVQTAAATPLPPPGFAVKPAPTPAEQAAMLAQQKPPKQMTFAEWQLILSAGNPQAADTVWNAIKGVPLQMQAQVIQASTTRILLAATVDDIEQKRADVELTMAAALPARLVPKEGQMITFEGTPTAYQPNPFMMQISKGALLTKPGAAAAGGAAKSGATTKKGTTTTRKPRR